jgi:electron transfer flavoprotein alpha subunit
VTANGSAVPVLAALAADSVSALVVGSAQAAQAAAEGPVAEVVWIEPEPNTPPEAYAPAAAKAAASAAPEVVIAENTPEGRALAGAVAVALGAAVVPGASAWHTDDGVTRVEYARHGGIVEEVLDVAGPVVVLRDAVGDPPAPTAAAPIRKVPAQGLAATVVDEAQAPTESVDLTAAKTVIGVGRGLKAEADLALIEELAKALRGEIGCTRPLAEGVTWLSKSRYIGMSGATIAPTLYLAIGISGQLQHMAGVRGAKRIVAVNTDDAAPVFAEADYGIVGDLYAIVPAIAAALGT